MNKKQIAIFDSRCVIGIDADGKEIYQQSVTLVCDSSKSKGYFAVSFAKTGVTFVGTSLQSVYLLHSTNYDAADINGDAEYIEIIRNAFPKSTYVDIQMMYTNSVSKVIIDTKEDLLFLDNRFSGFLSPYRMDDKDTNGVKLIDWFKSQSVFEFSDESKVVDYQLSTSSKRKFAAKKLDRDFSKTWNSTALSDLEKGYLKVKGDLDVLMSDIDKDMFKAIKRTCTVSYPERKWVLNILFGDPSSGKTTMVQALAKLLNAPLIKLTGDANITLVKMLMIVGPENIVKQLQDAEFYKAKLREAGADEATIESCKDEIAKAILTSKEVDIQLTEQQSILLKLILNNLAGIVFLDEINIFTTILQSTLADVITSGYVNVGIHTYKFNPENIIWFGAYNPDTYKASPFESKFRDRALFFCVEMPTEDEIISHKQRKYLADMFGCSAQIKDIIDKCDNTLADHPELKDDIEKVKEDIKEAADLTTPSGDALKWYSTYRLEELLGCRHNLTFDKGVFTDYYQGDVAIDSDSQMMEGVRRIILLVNKVNVKLKELTKGIDSKNPNRDAYFEICNRSIDYLIDLIFCFSDVDKALKFFIYNLIPNGGTVKFNTSSNPAKDIANTITQTFSIDIEELNKFLFSNYPIKEVDESLQRFDSTVFDSSLFTPISPNSNANASSSKQTIYEKLDDFANGISSQED